MASSKASTVAAYLDELPPDRRKAISSVRSLVRKHIPKGYSEGMGWGMITWHIPLSDYPDTYNGQPLCYVALAAQKNYCSLYLMGVYGDPAREKVLKDGFTNAGKKLDMGKSCVHFKSADDLPLDVIGDVIAGMPPEKLIAAIERAHGKKRSARKRVS
ncbi:MAG: DUF1801 domain-containing protein [Gemmatimonadaceae bacterium]|nr:DUF1801 domain-containing protein [Gemmatimonadaceae bacterium]